MSLLLVDISRFVMALPRISDCFIMFHIFKINGAYSSHLLLVLIKPLYGLSYCFSEAFTLKIKF